MDRPGTFPVAPYFDVLLSRLDAGDPRTRAAFGRHVHWGWWPDPAAADGTAEDYGAAAERLCRKVCDAAGVTDGLRVLDVGCGLGGTVASLNERFTGLDLVGLNLDPRQLARAADTVRPANGNRVRWVEADACSLPFADGSFDVVLAVECVFHFPSRARFLAEAGRVLAAGGRLGLSDFLPPAESAAAVRANPPGRDEATVQSFGRVDLTCSADEYRELAAAGGLAAGVAEDVTAGTMPTYAFLRADLRRVGDRSARVHERATARLETACRAGLLRYTVLGFARAAAAARAA